MPRLLRRTLQPERPQPRHRSPQWVLHRPLCQHTHRQRERHTHTHTHTQTQRGRGTQSHMHTYAHIHRHAHIHTRARTHAYANLPTNKQINKQTHTHQAGKAGRVVPRRRVARVRIALSGGGGGGVCCRWRRTCGGCLRRRHAGLGGRPALAALQPRQRSLSLREGPVRLTSDSQLGPLPGV
jgi:hypothetical protein